MPGLTHTFGQIRPQVLSLDIFDTLLLRGTRPEFLRFADVAHRQSQALFQAGVAMDAKTLFAARLRHTRRAYAQARAADGEVRFIDILNCLCDELGLSPDWIPKLVALEVEYETRHLAPNTRLTRHIPEWIGAGTKVVACSDTPFGADVISVLMHRMLPGLPPIPLYASADHGCTKRTGGLFVRLCSDLGVSPSNVLHVGDNLHSDVDMARRHGLHALHLPRPWWWRAVHGWRAKRIRRHLQSQGLIP